MVRIRTARMLLVGAGVCLTLAAASAETRIGIAAAVQNDVLGIRPAGERDLATGSDVFELERIRTGDNSIAQLLFLDETSLSVGPGSEVVLDRFVYDPNAGTGDVLLSATRGAFRFVSGSQNPLNYKIETPSATIGIRGTILDCAIGSLTCVVQEGTAIITVDGIDHPIGPGDAFTVSDDGTTTGPYQHDGVFDAAGGGTGWPLFSDASPTETFEIEIPDDSTIRVEDITSGEGQGQGNGVQGAQGNGNGLQGNGNGLQGAQGCCLE